MAFTAQDGIEMDKLVEELVALGKRNQVLKADRPVVRAVGEKANALGGLAAMQVVAISLRERWRAGQVGPYPGGEFDFHPAEVEAAWNGIGVWEN